MKVSPSTQPQGSMDPNFIRLSCQHLAVFVALITQMLFSSSLLILSALRPGIFKVGLSNQDMLAIFIVVDFTLMMSSLILTSKALDIIFRRHPTWLLWIMFRRGNEDTIGDVEKGTVGGETMVSVMKK